MLRLLHTLSHVDLGKRLITIMIGGVSGHTNKQTTNMSHLMTKPTKWHVRPAKTQISLGIRPVFTVRMKKAWVLSYPLSAQRRLIRLGRCPGWSSSSLGAEVILLVLSWGGFRDLSCWTCFLCNESYVFPIQVCYFSGDVRDANESCLSKHFTNTIISCKSLMSEVKCIIRLGKT